MAPAAVIGHAEIGKAAPGHCGDAPGDRAEPLGREAEMAGAAALGGVEHLGAALAHRRRAEEIGGLGHRLTRPGCGL